MKSVRSLVGLVCGVACLALFSGCETQQSACEREKRLTERMDEMQMDLDSRIMGVNGELANIRNSPPVVVQQMPVESSIGMPIDSIAIEDNYYPSKRDELEALAMSSREQQLYAPPPAPRASANTNIIRVPVPVRTIQGALKEAGFYNGNIDGKVGPQTRSAITSFQRSQGLKADGIVGRATWNALQAFVPAGMSTTRLK
jgi:Putative peptidoglycan-binding domain-containing protein